jgi:hypothetical protein
MPPIILYPNTTSLLTNSSFNEKIPINNLISLLKSNHIKNKWTTDDEYNSAKYYYINEYKQLETYLNKYNNLTGSISVTYKKTKKNENYTDYGRAFPSKAIGLTSFRRVIRNTIIKDHYYDLDLQNAQLHILLNICKSNNIYCKNLENYVNNRDNILKSYCDIYNTSKFNCKKLFISLSFFGSFEKWCLDYNISNTIPDKFLVEFKKEIEQIAKTLKIHNIRLYEAIRKDKITKNTKNFYGSFLSVYLQEYEFQIISTIIEYLNNNTKLLGNDKVCIYEFDGIKLYKEYVDNQSNINDLITLLNQKTLELTGFNLIWVNKPIDEYLDIDIIDNTLDLENYILKLNEIRDFLKPLTLDKGLADFMKSLYPDDFIYNPKNKTWACWNRKMRKWDMEQTELNLRISDELFSKIKNRVFIFYNDKLATSETVKLEKEIDDLLNKIEFKCSDYTQINKLIGMCQHKYANAKLEFNDNPNLFGCDNGVLDLNFKDIKSGKTIIAFRPSRQTDYITWSCGFNFQVINNQIPTYTENIEGELEQVPFEEYIYANNKEKYDEITKILTQIFPDEKVRKLVLTIFSSGLSGKNIAKFK